MLIKTIIALSTVLTQCKKVYDEEIPFSWNTHYTLPVEHAIGQHEQWHPRGEISFKSSRTLTASFTDEVELNENEIEKLRDSAQDGDLYFIRTPIKIGGKFDDNINGTKYVSSFVKACFLYGSGLNEHIRVSIDLAGNVIGISISSPRSTCIEDFSGINGIFNSTVTVHQQVPGPVPDTQSFIKRLEQEKAEQAQGKGKDNRSFLAKYWMYIIPVVLVLMLNAQAEPEGGGQS